MITYNGKEFRNLVEQVLKNQKDIESINDINRSLADYGIKIIGFYDTIQDAKEDLGDPYEGPYGNAVGIGVSAPYDFYIWTRANNLSEVDYWQDVGTLAVLGPEGPQGVQGDKGDPGEPARIFTGRNLPTISGTENDIYLCVGGDNNLIGNVYKIKNGTWQLEGNIRGVQGVQGRQGNDGKQGKQGPPGEPGPQGDPGGFIKIAGILDNSEQLDSPTEIRDLEVAYLVGENKELWMQVGTNYDNAIWTNIGPLNVATYVSVDGQYQNIWNADTKLDKVNINDGEYHAYIVSDDGSQDLINISTVEDPDTLVLRGGSGEIYVPEWPVDPKEAASKSYVDSLIQDSETINTYWEGPDLSLHLNADLVADIERSVKTPTNPLGAKTFAIYNRDTGEVEWTSTASYVSDSYKAKYQNKANSWLPTAQAGTEYTLYPSSTGASFNMTVKKTDDSAENYTNLSYAHFYYIGKTAIYMQAYNGVQPVYCGMLKGIASVSACTCTLQRHASGTNL